MKTRLWIREKGQPTGREWRQIDEKTSVIYNGDQPELSSIIAKHAEKNGGKVLLPLTKLVITGNLKQCDQLVVAKTDGNWVMGDIVDAGEHYSPNMQDGEYSTPQMMLMDYAWHWVKLDNVIAGTNTSQLNPEQWWTYRMGAGTDDGTPLSETLKRKSFSIVTAYNWEEE